MASFEHIDLPVDFLPRIWCSILSQFLTTDPPLVFTLCCPHTCGPPDFEPWCSVCCACSPLSLYHLPPQFHRLFARSLPKPPALHRCSPSHSTVPSPFPSLSQSSVVISRQSSSCTSCQSGPFALHPDIPHVLPSSASVDASSLGLQLEHSAPHSEFGSPRVNCFLEMPGMSTTDRINDGRFSHNGHGVLRLEGQPAW